jgi:hypothetical protein
MAKALEVRKIVELSLRAPGFGARNLLFDRTSKKQIRRFARDDNSKVSSLYCANLNKFVLCFVEVIYRGDAAAAELLAYIEFSVISVPPW